MKNTIVKWLIYLTLIALYFLHNDIWYWFDSRLVMSIPIGLFYHILFCVTACIVMILLVKFAWPEHLEVEGEEGSEL
jgi:hypothetical protein